MNSVFIPKDDQDLPDHFGCTVYYVDGKSELFEVAHYLPILNGVFEFWTSDNICSWVMINNVKRIEWDKKFSRMVELQRKISKKMGSNKIKENKYDEG